MKKLTKVLYLLMWVWMSAMVANTICLTYFSLTVGVVPTWLTCSVVCSILLFVVWIIGAFIDYYNKKNEN